MNEQFANVKFSTITNSEIHHTVKFVGWANVYDAQIGANCTVGPFVEIGGAKIGDRTVISSHSYVCPHVEIGRDCFIGHGVKFTNDLFETPKSYDNINEMRAAWTPRRTVVGDCVRIGTGARILANIRIGDHAVIGAGAVVTKDVAPGATVKGVPAKE